MFMLVLIYDLIDLICCLNLNLNLVNVSVRYARSYTVANNN